jgi:hypothetical protein
MGAAENRNKSQAMAQYMKDRGITRTTGRCCICSGIIGIPTDNHFRGQACQPRRRGAARKAKR